MTKIIEFSHCGEQIRSVAIINLDSSECSVMVMPYEHKDELGNSIVINRKDHHWQSDSSIVDTHKITYLNILNQLNILVAPYVN
ncbi:MAG: hypothetical protein JST21_15815 [Bacteroidetes bacterium]|nr:hypothetical protein [Bacteroidota bacterium]